MSDAVTTFYGRWARLYDLVARRTPGVTATRARAVDALGLEPGDSVVEMGCGTGANVPYLCDRVDPAGHVIGIDLTPGVLKHAASRADRENREAVHLVRGDASRPPIRSADAVLATFVVGMLEDPAAAVERWCDLVEPDGRVALLDATRSDRSGTAPFNALFGGFVRVTAPPGTKLRYEEPPASVLDRRVEAARAALASRGEVVVDETRLGGFLRLTAAKL